MREKKLKTRLKTIKSAVIEAMKTPIELIQLLNTFDIVDFSFIGLALFSLKTRHRFDTLTVKNLWLDI